MLEPILKSEKAIRSLHAYNSPKLTGDAGCLDVSPEGVVHNECGISSEAHQLPSFVGIRLGLRK
jgi:hypothetical protein